MSFWDRKHLGRKNGVRRHFAINYKTNTHCTIEQLVKAELHYIVFLAKQ